MARTFRRQRTMQPIAELNVTNLIDLGFVLLIIFMIASTVIKQEETLPVDLPIASMSAQQKSPDAKFETVLVRANGTYLFGTRTVTLTELRREFTTLANQDNPPTIHLRLDKDATAQAYVSVLDEMTKRGLNKMSIDYKLAE